MLSRACQAVKVAPNIKPTNNTCSGIWERNLCSETRSVTAQLEIKNVLVITREASDDNICHGRQGAEPFYPRKNLGIVELQIVPRTA